VRAGTGRALDALARLPAADRHAAARVLRDGAAGLRRAIQANLDPHPHTGGAPRAVDTAHVARLTARAAAAERVADALSPPRPARRGTDRTTPPRTDHA
jgi:hypothetical protein